MVRLGSFRGAVLRLQGGLRHLLPCVVSSLPAVSSEVIAVVPSDGRLRALVLSRPPR